MMNGQGYPPQEFFKKPEKICEKTE